MYATYLWSKGEIVMNKEDIWASKSKVSHQVAWLGRRFYGEVLPKKKKVEIILKKSNNFTEI